MKWMSFTIHEIKKHWIFNEVSGSSSRLLAEYAISNVLRTLPDSAIFSGYVRLVYIDWVRSKIPSLFTAKIATRHKLHRRHTPARKFISKPHLLINGQREVLVRRYWGGGTGEEVPVGQGQRTVTTGCGREYSCLTNVPTPSNK